MAAVEQVAIPRWNPQSWRPLAREELAELIGVHPKTVIRWESDGLIRTIWMGGKKRVPPSEVLRIVEHGVDLDGGQR